MDNQLAYDRIISNNINDIGKEHKIVLDWVGHNKKVLEVACHTGYVSAWLQRQGCEVTGAEIYGPALEKAKPYLHRSVLGNIEDTEVWSDIAKEKYDVVLYMHILEHLVNPDEILKKTQDILTPGGNVIICLPNISNWENRWEIFKGDFKYTDIGVMDRTHLKFFNYFTAIELIEKEGFKVDKYSGQSWPIRFKIFPDRGILSRINDYFNRLIHKFTGPNFTDRITMYYISSANV